MNIAVIGLGRMGLSVAIRLLKAGHHVCGYDLDEKNKQLAKDEGVHLVSDLSALADHCNFYWLMIPAGKVVDTVLEQLLPQLKPNDVVIDGGNSFYKDSIRRAAHLEKQHISFLDCGTSGGLHGREIGFSLMIGGDKKAYESALSIFKAVAAPQGYALVGSSGAGHYVKMVHNGIEYALLQAYGEGFHLLHKGHFKELDLAQICSVWEHGSIIRSWLLSLSTPIFEKDQKLSDISGSIGENKTGAWTLEAAQEKEIPVPLIEKSLQLRAWSRQTGGNYATKVVALLRHAFGGHPINKKEK